MEREISFVDLIISGSAAGGLRRNCHPKMLPFLREVKKSYSSINLNLTKVKVKEVSAAFEQLKTQEKKVLFVATKPRLRKMLSDLVDGTPHYYVNYRWLGGLLTNFEILSNRIETLQKVRQTESSGALENLSKREQMMFHKRKYRLERALRGIVNMQKLPDCLVLIDPKTELIALTEAEKLGLPVYALTNLEINPDRFTNFIPMNDNSERSVKLVLQHLLQHLLPAGAVSVSNEKNLSGLSASSSSPVEKPTKPSLSK